MTTTSWTLADIESAIRAGWSADLACPSDITRIPWSADNPAWGHCDITALVVQDLFGGDLMVGEVFLDGRQEGYHCWNRLAGGIRVDLTREQFRRGETVTPGRVVRRAADRRPRRWEEYQLLRQRVMDELGPLPGVVEVAGRTLRYTDFGGPGEPLLALHAHFMEGRTFARLARELAPRWRVIALDQRGHGDSDRAPEYSREGYVADAAAVLDHLMPGPAVVLGHSLGGVNAFQLAARRPELVRAVVVEDIGAVVDDDLSFVLDWPRRAGSREELIAGLGVRRASWRTRCGSTRTAGGWPSTRRTSWRPARRYRGTTGRTGWRCGSRRCWSGGPQHGAVGGARAGDGGPAAGGAAGGAARRARGAHR